MLTCINKVLHFFIGPGMGWMKIRINRLQSDYMLPLFSLSFPDHQSRYVVRMCRQWHYCSCYGSTVPRAQPEVAFKP